MGTLTGSLIKCFCQTFLQETLNMEVNLASRGHGQAVSSPLVSLHLDITVTVFDEDSLIALDSDHISLSRECVFSRLSLLWHY